MLKLSKDQKEALKSLVNHPWFTVVEQLEEEARIELWQWVLSADLTNKDHLKVIKENQTYVKARKDFLQNIKKHTAEIYNPINTIL